MTSRIGLSSYAFFWQLSDKVSEPLSIHDALERTAELGVDLFQVCDYAPLEEMDDAGLAAVRATADSLGINLELGTKGIRREHLGSSCTSREFWDPRCCGPCSTPRATPPPLRKQWPFSRRRCRTSRQPG